MDAIAPNDWARLSTRDFPFTQHEYLYALEAGESVSPQTGWAPLILTAWNGGELDAASFLYLKGHSYGEYIFDWAWAQAYQQHGVEYYPKVLSAVPFTPATGPKLLFPDSTGTAERSKLADLLLTAAKEKTESLGASSLHYLFLTPEEVPHFERAGFLIRHSFQYHWKNQNFSCFSDFLETLKPRKRKQILRERDELKSHGLKISVLSGDALTPAHATLFHGFYKSTIEKMDAIAYLTPAFFTLVFLTMRNEIKLVLAEENGVPVAAALFYEKGDTLFGRYWGASRGVRHLHFELCYYQGIEYAIQKGLKRFEAGAQGEHKVARGFLPELTLSAHWIRHPQFAKAIAAFIEEEKAVIESYFEQMKGHSPYGTQTQGDGKCY